MRSVLLCPEVSTVTNLICLSGSQHSDWSAEYRLYSKDRVDENILFDAALNEVLAALPETAPLVVALDDTLVRKCGTHINGVAWRRDPLGPAFQTNLVRGQRFLQMSAAWPLQEGAARMVPILFQHAPTAPKLPRDADLKQQELHKETLRQMNLNTYALEQMKRLRGTVPVEREIVYCGDGSYTNATIIKGLPTGCTYIGRTRKDAKLHALPEIDPTKKLNGRPLCYGSVLSTPEELRMDGSVAWKKVTAYAAGKTHEFRIKTHDKVLWRKTGTRQALKVVVIAPLGYRLRKGGKLLYRQPAFLICTDLELPLEQLLQHYLWRWGIEVNFRDEKTLLGAGEAHVRTASSNRHLPAVIVASYALLWVAALRMHQRESLPPGMIPPKWRRKSQEGKILPSTGDLLRTLRYESWRRVIRPAAFHHFTASSNPDTKSKKPSVDLPSALFAVA